ncbi:MAG: FtsX-like permease family protein [Bdellovibrionota bacterium]
MSFARKIALRYLWTKRSEAFISIITIISILGVAIGVAVLNIVMSVMTGFEYELKTKILSTDSHIVVRRLGGKISDWQTMSDTIRAIDGVATVSPVLTQQALIRTEDRSTGVIIRAVAPETDAARQVEDFLTEGSKINDLFNPAPIEAATSSGASEEVSLPALIVGKELSKNLGLLPGRPVSLLSANVSSSPFGLVPKYKRFVVSGLYSSGLIEYESGVAYASLAEAQKFFRFKDSITGFEIRVDDVENAPALSQTIVDSLGGLSTGFYAQDWTITNKPLWDALRLEKKVYFIVLLLIIVMASFSIVSTLIMLVLEKRKDIAILRTMGASSEDVASIFRFQGAIIGGIGTLAGLLLGFTGCLLLKTYGFPIDERIFQMSELPIKIEPLNFLIVALAAFAICYLSTIYPARRASKLEPSSVLRYE